MDAFKWEPDKNAIKSTDFSEAEVWNSFHCAMYRRRIRMAKLQINYKSGEIYFEFLNRKLFSAKRKSQTKITWSQTKNKGTDIFN